MLTQYVRGLKDIVSKHIDSHQTRSRTNNTSKLGYETLERRLLLAAVTPDWVFGIGGADLQGDVVQEVAAGTSGNVFVSGYFWGTVDFDPGPGVENLTANPNVEVTNGFVAKYTSSGDFLWVRNMEGVRSITDSAVDELENVYLTGHFFTMAQIGNKTLIAPSQGPDTFITKLDSNGNFEWADNPHTEAGVGGGVRGDIAVDDSPANHADWSVYMTTRSNSKLSNELWKFDAETGDILWTKQIRGNGRFGNWRSEAEGLAVDDTGDVYLAGEFLHKVSFDDIQLDAGDGWNQFVARLDAAGNFQWVKQFAGSHVFELAVGDQNVYAMGTFTGTNDFDPGTNTFELTSAGGVDGYVLALDKSLGEFVWATSMGGVGTDYIDDIDVHQGNIYGTGRFSDVADFGSQSLTSLGAYDGFVSQIDSNGDFVETWQIAGPNWDYGVGIAVDTSGNVYATGRFNSTADFPTGDQLTAQGNGDGFVMKFAIADPNNLPPIANAAGPYLGSEDGAILFDASGSSDPDLDGLSYQWDFGDGTPIVDTTDPTIFHTYAWGETFVVTLTVSDGRGGSDSTTATATVSEINDLPIADDGGPYSGNEGVAITFDASASTDFDNQDGTTANDQPLEYTWDFGDGSGSITTASPTINYTYSAAGNYNVSVSVSDAVASDIALTTAAIAAPPTGDPNDIYVWDIYFDQRTRGSKHDARFYIDVNRDSDADGLAATSDAAAAGVIATVELRDSSGSLIGAYSGTTDSAGIFRSNWIRDLAIGEYTAEVIDLNHATFNWNQLFTFNDDDEDGDGLPDDFFTVS